jgi:hypothetical protein
MRLLVVFLAFTANLGMAASIGVFASTQTDVDLIPPPTGVFVLGNPPANYDLILWPISILTPSGQSFVPVPVASVLLTAGQSFDFTFESMNFVGASTDESHLYTAGFVVSLNGFQDGSEVEMSLYETSTSGVAFRVGQFTSEGGLLGLVGIHNQAWQDMQGAIRFTVISGNIELESIYSRTVIDGNVYEATSQIPEPSSFAIIAGLGSLFGALFYKRKHAQA